MLCILSMITRNVYVIQPYEVGTKERKSLAIIIPAQVAREYEVSKSTILALRINEKGRNFTLQKVNMTDENMMTPATESSSTCNTHASSRGQ